MTDNPLAFALEILKLLAEKPRYRSELSSLMTEYLERQGISTGDILQKVTRTIRKLKECGFDIKSAPHSPYTLKNSNFPVILSPEQRKALYLSAYFLNSMGFSAQASQIYRIGNLSDSAPQRGSLWDRPSDVKVDFNPPIDYSETQIEKTVQTLQERIETGCYYQIRYQNHQKEENNFDLALSELRFHNGILYLFAYVRDAKFKYFDKAPNVEQNYLFRIDRITYIYPSSNSLWFWQNFPTVTVRYRMTGALANYQPRRHQEKVLEQNSTKKYVEIETEEDYLFWFRQRILQYGKNVQVLAPDWLAQDIAQEWYQAYHNYDSSNEES